MQPTAIEVAERLYERWNENRLSVMTASVDPAVELVCDPLRPNESALHGIDGWKRWVARWEESYDTMHVAVDGVIPLDPESVLALVSISATPRSGQQELRWAAAHLWTVRDGRIARWESHVDLAAARQTLL
ncbi:MAG: nuclear transport factor 2 family protein [Solirubrobacteraceae bacterium]|nr:nuclear transport factor 2 family protein [Solirubrobacteraceae bacterium]